MQVDSHLRHVRRAQHHICEALAKSGVKAAHIDGKTPKEERDETLRQLTAGEIEVVCNCQLLTEGYDLPALGCVVLARPTKSMGLFRQMVGRVLTPAPGKTFALVLDHAGAVFRHGFIEEPVTWTLDPDKRPVAPIQDGRGQAQHTSHHLVTCKQCSAVRTAGKPCPQCGYMPRRQGRDVETHEGG
jgi:DNA repair protein RadD